MLTHSNNSLFGYIIIKIRWGLPQKRKRKVFAWLFPAWPEVDHTGGEI